MWVETSKSKAKNEREKGVEMVEIVEKWAPLFLILLFAVAVLVTRRCWKCGQVRDMCCHSGMGSYDGWAHHACLNPKCEWRCKGE